MNVYICHFPDHTQSEYVAHVPYIHGVLKSYALQSETVRAHYRFCPPLWRPAPRLRMLDHFVEPAVVGFSTYVWNMRNSLRLAQELKARHPSCLIVFGGPQVSNVPSDLLAQAPWIDLLVHGEGGQAFRGLLEEALNPKPEWRRVSGVSFLEHGRQVFSDPGSRLRQLEYPSPYLEGYFDDLLAEIRETNPNVTVMASMETNRGCPYSCSFCDWGMATMSKLRRFPEERVRGELDWASRQGIQGIILNDANFGILPRDVGLAEYAAGLKKDTGFPTYFYPLGLAKNNKDRAFAINKIIIDNGFDPFGMNVNFSLQATSQTTLDAIARQNIPLDNYRELADRYAQEGYKLTPDLILPLPGETLHSFTEGYADLASWQHVARIRVYPCGILPNAPMACPHYRQKWGIVTRSLPLGAQMVRSDDSEIEMIETVVATSTMSETEHSEAKLFVALVNALELYGLLRHVRAYVCKEAGLSAGAFYRGLREFQEHTGGVLSEAIASIRSPLFARTYSDELVSTGVAHTHDGRALKHHKVIAYDALTRANRFVEELDAWARSLGVGIPEELLRFEYERWLLPNYEPTREYRFEYGTDWPGLLRTGEQAGPCEVRYLPRPEFMKFPYQVGLKSWMTSVLAVNSVDTPCVHKAQ